MKTGNAILINSLAAIALLAYIIASATLYSQKNNENRCSKLIINIRDSAQYKFVTTKIITQWLDSANLNPTGKLTHQLQLNRIERLIKLKDFVQTAQVHSAMDGTCTIDISQYHPKIRITTSTGYDFYVDSTGAILKPLTNFTPNIPIVTGNVNFSFPIAFKGSLHEKNVLQDKVFLENLINFVNFIANDDLLSKLIVQIWIRTDKKIELVPLIANQTIIVGELNNQYYEKLLKLKKIYTQTFKNGWWKTTTTVNLEFKNQVILK